MNAPNTRSTILSGKNLLWLISVLVLAVIVLSSNRFARTLLDWWEGDFVVWSEWRVNTGGRIRVLSQTSQILVVGFRKEGADKISGEDALTFRKGVGAKLSPTEIETFCGRQQCTSFETGAMPIAGTVYKVVKFEADIKGVALRYHAYYYPENGDVTIEFHGSRATYPTVEDLLGSITPVR